MHIVWTDDFVAGIDDIDRQHKELIVTYNELVDACVGDGGPLRPAAVMNLLTGKIKAHTKAEEDLLAAHGYPLSEQHSSDHREFLRDVEDLEYRFMTGGDPGLKLGSLRSIGQKLVDHTKSDDVHGFEFLKSRMDL